MFVFFALGELYQLGKTQGERHSASVGVPGGTIAIQGGFGHGEPQRIVCSERRRVFTNDDGITDPPSARKM